MRAIAVATTAIVLGSAPLVLESHDFSRNPVTWNREVSRIVYDRCASCHRAGGTSFSLMTYREAQPHANAIRDAVLSRRMPPWGAVKGFGEFRNDTSLTQEQIELIAAWVDGDAPRGNNANTLPQPPKFESAAADPAQTNGIQVAGDVRLRQSITLKGVLPQNVPAHRSLQVTAILPDGAIKPLVWLYEYHDAYQHPFLFREPIALPAGTVIKGVRAPSKILLLLP